MNYILNVSGKTFEIQKEILNKSAYFNDMLADCDDKNKVIFVPRSSKLFDHVLSYVIDPLYPYPKKYEYELKFYGVNYDKLYDKNEEIISFINMKFSRTDNELGCIRNFNDEINDELKEIKNNTKDYMRDSNKSEITRICRTCTDICCEDSLHCYNHKSCLTCYRNPEDGYNYCEDHINSGSYCVKGGCSDLRTDYHKFCKEHY